MTKQRAFLAAYSLTGNISEAARAANTARRSHYEWMADPAYAELFAEASAEACDALETEARRRATEGVQEPVIYQGQLQYLPALTKKGTIRKDRKGRTVWSDKPLTVAKKSDLLLIFLMKAAMPDKYRENVKVEHSGELNLIVERLAAARKRTKG